MDATRMDLFTANEIALHNANTYEPLSDWLLRYLVDAANQKGLQIGITLQVGGMLVSGVLVSGQTYFDNITSDISEALAGNDQTKGIAEMFESVNRAIHAGTTPDVPTPTPAYIHLKDAYFFHSADSAPIPNGQGVWWRGKLSQVAGFFLGNLSV